jgi:hypothetical protein
MVESSPVDVSRQRLLHSVQRPEGPQRAPLAPESGAPYFENAVRSLVGKGVREEERVMVRGNLENGFRSAAARIVDRSGLVLSNYGDLEDLVFDEDRLKVLPRNKAKRAKELCYSIMDGVVLGLLFDDMEDSLKEAIEKKDAKEIEGALGVGALEGIGRVVVETSIADDKLKRALYVLQGKVRMDGTFAEKDVRRVLDKVDDWLLDGAVVQSEADMVVAYLTAFMTSEERGTQEAQEREVGTQVAENDLQRQYFERQVELGKKIEAVTYREWLDSLMSKPAPVSRQPSLWELEPPEWLESGDLQEWRDVLSMVDGMSVTVAQRRKDNNFKTIITDRGGAGVKEKIMGYFELPEKYLKWLYDHPSFGFRPVLETITRELFARNGEGVFEFKDPDTSRETKAFLEDSGEYKKGLVQRLLDSGVVRSLDQGYIMVSMAADFLELGGQLETADTNRKIGYISDALRVVMRPVTKFSSKARGGELWGGGWSNYLMELYGKDNVMTVADRMGIMPHVLCGSVANVMVEVQGGRKMSLGDALMTGQNISFNNTEGDFYFTTKKKIIAACDIWTYISGDKPLQFPKLEEFDNILMAWKKGLHNAVIELSDGGEKHNLRGNITPGVVAAAIGGSTGLWPFEGPYLWIAEKAADYRMMVAQIVRQVTVDSAQVKRLEKFFGIGGLAYNDDEMFETKLARYKYSIGGAPQFMKKLFGHDKTPGGDFRRVKRV